MQKLAVLTAIVWMAFMTIATAQPGGQRVAKERPSAAELMERMDANSDGFIAEAETRGPLQRNFAIIDTDSDGLISITELENAPKPQGRSRRDKQPRNTDVLDDQTTPSERGQNRRQNRPSSAQLLERLDVNNDGSISRDEATESRRLNERFDTIDTNEDGFISITELENAPKPQGRRGRGNQKG